MLFNSFEFLLFLPIVFAIYWCLRGSLRWQNLWVVAASYVFYGWWDWRFLLLITLTTVCSYATGLAIGHIRAKTDATRIEAESISAEKREYAIVEKREDAIAEKKAKWINIANIVLNLGILAMFKYYNFFIENAAAMFGLSADGFTLKWILPVGISFYTFQALSYSIDVYKKKIEPTADLIGFAAYISFFPQLVAGPIERATNLLPQFLKKRSFDYTLAADGMRQILLGLFKKMIVADHCTAFVDYVWENYQSAHLGGTMMIAGAIAFSFQIYGDFSGYSDIAIGTARLFGINLRKNFNLPYFSRDVSEFWKRWHISLNTWFVDYVYIPLGGSREGKAKTIRNTFVIFLLSGLWHGANWTYVTWGLYHALLFVPLLAFGKSKRFKNVVAEGHWLPTFKELCQMGGTFILATIGWIIFRAPSISEAFDFILAMVSRIAQYSPLGNHLINFYLIALLLLIEWLNRSREHAMSFVPIPWKLLRWAVYAAAFILIIVNRGNQVEFIYFQF